MKRIRFFFALALVAGFAATADAVVTIRTAPGNPSPGGLSQCLVTNGGAAPGTASLALFSFTADKPLATDSGLVLGPNQSSFGSTIVTTNDIDTNPSWCECTVPDKANFRCSYVVVSGANVTVVPAQ